MIYNVIATISKLSGNENSKSYATLANNARIFIAPADTNTVVLFPEIPIGQAFNFFITSNDVGIIPAESTITTTTDVTGEIVVGSQFITKGNTKIQKIFGNITISGVCAKL